MGGTAGCAPRTAQPLAREHRVVVVRIDVGRRAGSSSVACLRKVMLLVLEDAAAPVERAGDLRAARLAVDLFIHQTR